MSPRSPSSQTCDDVEVEGILEGIGHGNSRSLHLLPGLWLSFYEQESQQDWKLEVAAHDHPIQMTVWLAGFIDFDAVHPTLG
ncbi:MAG: AraC family transcriptional regulator, partial [Cyanobacteria bacterium J06636_28]